MEEQEDELSKQMELLERGLAELKLATAQALGFVRSVDHEGIHFNISRRFVIADLSPLAFFHLIEPIDQTVPNGVETAVAALYHRLQPLLTCRHEWTGLKRAEDERVLSIMTGDHLRDGPRPKVCKACTAYALSQSLPDVGRSFDGPHEPPHDKGARVNPINPR